MCGSYEGIRIILRYFIRLLRFAIVDNFVALQEVECTSQDVVRSTLSNVFFGD